MMVTIRHHRRRRRGTPKFVALLRRRDQKKVTVKIKSESLGKILRESANDDVCSQIYLDVFSNSTGHLGSVRRFPFSPLTIFF
jgi:hypothetical protein